MYLNVQDTSFNDFMLILLFSFCQEGHYEERLIPQEFHTFIPDQTSLAKLNRNPISDVHQYSLLLTKLQQKFFHKNFNKKKKNKILAFVSLSKFRRSKKNFSPNVPQIFITRIIFLTKFSMIQSLILSKPIKLSILPSNANKKTTPL